MTDRSPPGRGLLTSPRAGDLLSATLAAVGEQLVDWSMRSVHARTESLSVIYACTLAGRGGRMDRPVQLVAHTSNRTVPDGAAQVEVGDYVVHVWRVPDDPYLPGLAAALRPRSVRALLDQLDVEDGPVQLRTRAYRPTRRAVVEVGLTPPGRRLRALYLKVMGGRRPSRVAERTHALADAHRRMADAGLPVPVVVGVDAPKGIVAIRAVAGDTLRAHVVDEAARLPDPEVLVDLAGRVAALPLDTGSADPRGYASAARHVPGLARLLPDVADDVARTATLADAVDGDTVTVHGDLHDGQILLRDGEVTGLLDVDGVGPGLLAQDLGRLVAHVEVAAHTHPAVADRVQSYAAALADAFRPVVGAEALARGAAGAWLGLATGPYRAQDDGWQEETRARLRRAQHWLTSVGL